MNVSDTNALRDRLNPAVLTARAALMGGVANGDEYAIKLFHLISDDERFEESLNDTSAKKTGVLYRFSSAYGNVVWVRNKIADYLFRALRMTSFIDLGCGLNPRGLSLAQNNFLRYYGFDLPAVTEKMSRSMQFMIGAGTLNERIMYIPADITDRKALRSVIRGNRPLFIVTEGLMMYLTENEMRTVIDNISSLLSEYGGVWFTGDAEERIIFEKMARMMTADESADAKMFESSEFSKKWRRLIFENSFIKLNDDERAEFLKGYDLNCRSIDTAPYIEKISMPDDIRAAFENTKFMLMTSGHSDNRYRQTGENNVFSLNSLKSENVIIIDIHGRLDAISAPKLVEEYERSSGSGNLPLIIDMSDCPYISSAGIRAILMLFKRTKELKDGFSLRNIRPDVLDILNTTGFNDLFHDI